MEFNHEQYVKDHAALKATLEADADQSWKEDLEVRYAEYLVRKVANQLRWQMAALEQAPQGADKLAIRNAVARGVWNTTAELSFAVALLGQNCGIKDAADAEATIRLFKAAANRPPAG